MKKRLTILTFFMALCSLVIGQQWGEVDIHKYPNNMSVVSVISIDDAEQTRTDLEIAAFCGDELRGWIKPQLYSGKYVAFITVQGEAKTTADKIYFKLYDPQTKSEYTSDYSVDFVVDATIGEIYPNFVPQTINFKSAAEVNGVKYGSLQTAINSAADGATVTVLENIELGAQNAQEMFKPAYNRESYCGIYVEDDKTVVLDLNGKTVSYVDTYVDLDNVMVMNLGNLTINDSKGDGKLTYKPVAGTSTYSKFYSTIFNCGTLTVNGGTIENTAEAETDVTNAVDNHSRLSHEYDNDCILTVNGGTLSGAYYYAIRQYTHYFEGVKNRVVINDGVINGGIYMQHGDSWYYADASANRLNVDSYLTIAGGEININTTSDQFGKIKVRLNNPDNNAYGLEITDGEINVPVELLVQRGYYYVNGVSGATTSETTGTRNAEWLEANDGFISGGTFTEHGTAGSTTDLTAFIKKGYKLEGNSVVVDPAYGKVAQIGEEYFATLQDAVNAVQDGQTITLIKDVTLTESLVLNTEGNITIDGAGFTISQAEGYTDKQNGFLMLGDSNYGDAEAATRNYTINNVVFDGVNDWSVIRAQGVTLTVDNCTIKNCEQANGQSLLRLDYTEAKIQNTTATANNALMFISHNFNGDESQKTLTVDNCVLANNTWNKIAAIYYVVGGGCTITNSEFINNDVNCNQNGAVIYLGFQKDCVVTKNLFQANEVKDASTSTRVAGAIFFGYEANIAGNAFVDNKASNANGSEGIAQDVCTSTYYECNIDLGGNYWGGNAPVAGVDYQIQHQDGKASFDLNNYYESYSTDENGNVVVADKVEFNYVAKVGKINAYTTLDAALKALTADATLTLVADVTVSDNWDCRSNGAKITVPVTIDGNGHTLKLTGNVDDKNWNTVFRFEADATVKNLTIDVTEATGVQRCITTKSSVVVEGCTFIGADTRYGIIVGEGAGSNIGNVTATISNCNFENLQAGVSDNANAQDAKSFAITECEFNNADAVISAAENVTFNKNKMVNGRVDIRSYANVDQLKVEALENDLDTNVDDPNQIIADLKNINAQDDFLTPVAEVNGKYYVTLQNAIDKTTAENNTVKVLQNVTLTEGVTVAADKTVVLDLNGKTISRNTEAQSATAAITNNGNLTIKDEAGEGKITAFAANPDTQDIPYYASNTITNCGVLTILSGTIENSTGDEARAAFPIDNNSTVRDAVLYIQGGTVTGRGAIRQFANSNTHKNEVNVTDGTVIGTSYAIWVQNPGSGDPVATLNISGGELSKILMDPNANFEGSITGGTITEVAIWEADETNPERNPSGFITGGTFKSDVTEFCKFGFTCKDNGDGTYGVVESASLEIATLAELVAFRNEVNAGNTFAGKTITLTASIDLAPATRSAASNWEPIGTEANPFMGTFDGGDNTISNLNIVETEAKEGKAYIGFFGYANIATIKNLTFENVNLNIACLDINHSQGHIGAVAGSLEGNSTIENVTVKGDVKVEATITANGASRVAVVAGGNSYGDVTMKNVHVKANEGSYLKANNNVGALAGQLQGKSVFENCSSDIDVTGTKFCAGGIIGIASGNTSFTDCHTTGNITITAGREGRANDHYRVGGIAGCWADGKTNVCTLTNCTYKGTVSGTNSDGSVAEILDYAGYVGRGYNLTSCAGSKVVIDGVEYVQAFNKDFGLYLVNGELTLNTADNLKTIAKKVNDGTNYFADTTVVLGADIDLNNENWTPIGSVFKDHGFMGNFDGKTYTIKNLTITDPASDSDGYVYAGLFGITEGTDKDNQNTIKNLTIENVTINTTGHIAAAAIAYPYYTIVDNVTVKGDITINGGDYTSGVLAYTRRCVNASNLTIDGNEGSVIAGAKTVGGVISDIQTNGGLIAEYSNFNASNVTVTGDMHVGGISGIISGQTLNKCSVKNVTLVCSDDRVGVVAGSLGTPSTISNVTVENVAGATAIVGAGYDSGKPVEARIGDTYYQTLQDAIATAEATEENETIKVAADFTTEEFYTVKGTVTLDLNGFTITGTDNTTANFGLININPGADLTINDSSEDKSGAITLTATTNSGWGRYSSVVSNQRGKLTVNGGTIEHLGGTDMAYAIDNLTNTGAQIAETVIYGGNIKSTYRAIRQFLNSTAEGVNNILTINGGTIESTGGNKSIWMQEANAGANPGELTVSETTVVKGNILLSAQAGATEWPVEVSIAAAALAEGSAVEINANVPSKYELQLVGGNYTVVELGAMARFDHENTPGAYANYAANKPREHFSINLYDVYAETSLVVKVYSGETHILTTTYREYDLDDTEKANPCYPVKTAEGKGLTVNNVVSGKEAGSWLNEWHENPTVANVPDKFEVYVDGTLTDTYDATSNASKGFRNADELNEYLAFNGVYKAASITNAEVTTYYATVASAVSAATAGDVITLLADITEDVAINKDLTIDGAEFKYTGNISVEGSTVDVIVKNVNFENGTGYAITTNRINSITVENCTVTNYGYGFLYANKSTPTVSVKDVTVEGGNYGMHWAYGSTATLENVTMTNVTYGLYIQNYASKTINVKGSDISSIAIWERDGYSGVQTFNFEGTNTVGDLENSDYAKYVLAAEGTTLTAPEGATVTTNLEGYGVKYVDGAYKVIPAVAKIGDVVYESIQEAIDAAVTGDEVVLLQNITLSDDDIMMVGQHKVMTNVDGKNITLNLNEKTITVDYTGGAHLIAVVRVADGAGLTVTGNGKIDVPTNGINVAYTFWKAGETGYLTIENGTFHMEDAGDSMVYTNGDEIVTVNGGTFTIDNIGTRDNGYPCIFNTNGQNTKNIIVNGGTYNADVLHQYYAFEVNSSENNAIVNNGDGTWTVVKDGAVAYVTERYAYSSAYTNKVGYATLEDAFAAAHTYNYVVEDEMSTVTLLKDAQLENTITIEEGKEVTLDLNGKTISAESTFAAKAIINNGTLTINGNEGTIDISASTTESIQVVDNYGALTINGGTYKGATSNYSYAIRANDENSVTNIEGATVMTHFGAVGVNKGKATITDGKFEVTSAAGGHALYVVNAEVTINGGEFIPYAQGYSYAVLTNDANANVSINGGTFNMGLNNSCVKALNGNGEILLTGGIYDADVNEYCAEDYAALRNFDDQYVVGVAPTATVNDFGQTTIPGGEYGIWDGSFSSTTEDDPDMPLSFVMQFLADQNAEDMATSPFSEWYGDFVITFTGLEDASFIADGCYLAGHYGSFGWVKIPVDGMTIEEGVRYPVMLGVGLGQQYDYICSSVEDFKCALYLTPEILAANPNIQVNLELAVVDNSDGSDAAAQALQTTDSPYTYKVVDYTYDAEDFAEPIAMIGDVIYKSLQAAFDAAQNGETVTIIADFKMTEGVEVTGKAVLDLNGHTITGTDNTTANFGLININPGADLTINDEVGTGTITLTATTNSGWGRYSSIVSNQRGKLTVNGGTIEHLGGTDMAYAIDNLTNGKGTYAETTIEGGTIKSTYRAIRQFLNGVEAQNILTVNGGTIESTGGNKSIWMQNPSANINSGKLTVAAGATLNSDVYVDMDGYPAETEELSVEVNVAKAALSEGTTVTASGLPTAYELIETEDEFTLEQVAGTLTRELAAGWSWFSSYVNTDLAGLKASLEGDGTREIEAKDGKFLNYHGTSWSGNLKVFNQAQMYKVKSSTVQTMKLQGEFIEETAIPLYHGMNWIAYTLKSEMTVNDALAYLNPENGDYIKSKDGKQSSYYSSKSAWYPEITLVPGEGYMYYSNASTSKTLVYSTEVTTTVTRSSKADVETYWSVDSRKYPSNMIMTAVVDGAMNNNYEVAAFVNGECRGTARPTYVPEFDTYVLFLAIHGEDVEKVTFRYYDIDTDTEYELSNSFNYSNDAMLGTIDNPYVFTRGTTGMDEFSLSNFNIYPNPTTTDSEINLSATFDKVEVFNALGVKVIEYQNVDSIDALETAGIYVIRVTNNGEARNCRLVVK